MGEIADMMIEGDLCESCGGYIDEDGVKVSHVFVTIVPT